MLLLGGSLAAGQALPPVPALPAAPAPEPQTAVPAAPGPVPQVTPKPAAPKKAGPPPPKFPSAVKWSVVVDAAPVAPPLVAEGRVVLALRSGALSAHAVADGAEVWSVKLPVDQQVAADAGRVFVVTGDTLHALGGGDGATLWSVRIGQPSAPILARGGWVIAASAGSVMALRAVDGEVVWTKPIGATSERGAIDGNALYLPLTEGLLVALDLESGAERWRRTVGVAPSEPLAYGDRVYLGSDSKRFLCLHAATGLEDWFWQIGTRLIGPPAADEARVYFTGMDNVLRALSRSNGGQRWRFPLAYRPTRGPVLMGPQIAVPGITGELIGVDVATGKATGKLTFPVQLAIGPAFMAPSGPGEAPAVVSITGGLTSQWTLSASMPAPPPPPAAAAPPKK